MVMGEICATTISPSTVLMRSLMMYHSLAFRSRINCFWVIHNHIPPPFSHSCSIISTSIAGSTSPNNWLRSDDALSPIECADTIVMGNSSSGGSSTTMVVNPTSTSRHRMERAPGRSGVRWSGERCELQLWLELVMGSLMMEGSNLPPVNSPLVRLNEPPIAPNP